MLFANMFGCVAIIGFSSCFLTLVAGSLDTEIVDCRQFQASADTTLAHITQEACRAYCLKKFPGRIFYAVVVTPGSTSGSCFCVDEPTKVSSHCRCGSCDNKCPNQPTETCGGTDGRCASFFKFTVDASIYTSPTGVISSPGYPAEYGAFSVDKFTIQANSSKQITLNFSVFDIEDGYDFLTIYSDGKWFAELTGSTVPAPIVIAATEVKFEFRSDDSVNAAGYSFNYSIEDLPAGNNRH